MAIKFPKIENKGAFVKTAHHSIAYTRNAATVYFTNKRIVDGTLAVLATEKLDGENFRFGIDETGLFIGTRNGHVYITPETNHNQVNKFNSECKQTLHDLESWLYDARRENHLPFLFNIKDDEYQFSENSDIYIVNNEPVDLIYRNASDILGSSSRLPEDGSDWKMVNNSWKIVDITMFGELVGDSMQRRFKWNHEGLDVVWYDMAVTVRPTEHLLNDPALVHLAELDNEGNTPIYTIYVGWAYMNNILKSYLMDKGYSNVESGFKMVQTIKDNALNEWDEEYSASEDHLSRSVYMLNGAYKIDIDALKPLTPTYATKGNMDGSEANRGIGEGIVLSSVLPTLYPVRLKLKSVKFSEVHDSTRSTGSKKAQFESEFAKFVTPERIRHAIQHVSEVESIKSDDLMDIRQLGKHIRFVAPRVIVDIEEEENGNNPLSSEDKKALSKLAVNTFKNVVLEGE